MHPTDHMSTAVEYFVAPSRISGALGKSGNGINKNSQDYTPIPECYYKLSHPSYAYRVSISSSEAEICHFDCATVIH